MQIPCRVMFRRVTVPVLGLFSLLFSCAVADAALISYSFTGNVSDVSGSLKPPLNLLSPVSGTFQFDSATPPLGTGNYPGAVKNLSLTIGSYSASFAPGPTNGINISNNEFLVGDRWRLQTSVSGPLNGFTPLLFDLNLTDENGDALSSTALQSPPSLGSLTSTRWRLIFENSDGVARIQGALTALTAVPLPAAVLLFGAGLISLVGLGAGGLRNLRRPQV